MSTTTPSPGGPNFSATRNSDKHSITVRAAGTNPTGGYHPLLTKDPTLIEPPMVSFHNPPPTGIVNQIVTPYDVSLSLEFPSKADSVTVNYNSKAHQVSIK